MKKNSRYLIKTPHNNFVDFEGIKKVQNPNKVKIVFTDETYIKCSHDHIFFDKNMKEVYAKDLKERDVLYGDEENKIVESIKKTRNSEDLYDLVNVDNEKLCYFTNGVLSHNCFVGSTYTLVNAETLTKIDALRKENIEKIYADKIMFGEFEIIVYHKPNKNRMYLASCDVCDGLGMDYTVIYVFDITDNKNITEVAHFSSNTIQTFQTPYVLSCLGKYYYSCPIIIESNSSGRSVIDSLFYMYDYENVPAIGGSKNLGIFSHNDVKIEACLNFKRIVENKDITFTVYTDKLVKEMQNFVRVDKLGASSSKITYKGADNSNDDHVMATIWALFSLTENNLPIMYDCDFRQVGEMEKFYINLKRYSPVKEYASIREITKRETDIYIGIKNKEITTGNPLPIQGSFEERAEAITKNYTDGHYEKQHEILKEKSW